MLLDTAGLLCLYHADVPFHVQAVTAYQAAQQRLTHSYILAEFVALVTARRFPRLPALQYMADLLDNLAVEVVWMEEAFHREAMVFLLARVDKGYSLSSGNRQTARGYGSATFGTAAVQPRHVARFC